MKNRKLEPGDYEYDEEYLREIDQEATDDVGNGRTKVLVSLEDLIS